MLEPWEDSTDEVLPRSDRLRILSPEEYELLWGMPRFSESDREVFFALSPRDTALLQRFRTPQTRAHVLLQLGYFRARQRFFALDRDMTAADLEHVCARHLDGAVVTDLALATHTRQRKRPSNPVLIADARARTVRAPVQQRSLYRCPPAQNAPPAGANMSKPTAQAA